MGSPTATLTHQVTTLLGAEAVQPWAEVALPQAQTLGAAFPPAAPPPACVALPATVTALEALMAQAHQEGWRVLPWGQGSKIAWGGLIDPVDVVVSTARLDQPLDHAVGDLTVTVGAGVTFATLQAHLAQAGQWLPLDPAYPDRATVGGIVATGDAGALRQRYGGVRDLVIGVTLVRHDGQRAKAGGKVVKNVAGYDLMKLMTGSYGTLGILAEVTLRTYPLAEAAQTVVFTGAGTAIATLAAAVRRSPLTPVMMDLLSPSVVNALELPGAADAYGLALEFQSIAAGVAEQVARVQQLASGESLICHEPRDTTTLWPQIQASLWAVSAPGCLLKVGILPTAVLELCQWLTAHCPQPWRGRFHCSSGIGQLWLPLSAATVPLLQSLRDYCTAGQGYAIVLEAPGTLKQQFDPWGLSPDQGRLMASLQAQFDPQGRLSPGRWGHLGSTV